jgi:hypothetical protein
VRNVTEPRLNILDLIKCTHYIRYDEKYIITHAYPATGILHITDSSPFFITGKLSMLGRGGGSYPHLYEGVINHLFGPEKIELRFAVVESREEPGHLVQHLLLLK